MTSDDVIDVIFLDHHHPGLQSHYSFLFPHCIPYSTPLSNNDASKALPAFVSLNRNILPFIQAPNWHCSHFCAFAQPAFDHQMLCFSTTIFSVCVLKSPTVPRNALPAFRIPIIPFINRPLTPLQILCICSAHFSVFLCSLIPLRPLCISTATSVSVIFSIFQGPVTFHDHSRSYPFLYYVIRGPFAFILSLDFLLWLTTESIPLRILITLRAWTL